jgi:iduronate 2-sulfatase
MVHARNNVLLFVVDDLRPWLGVYNESWISSPHIDQLAQGSSVFNAAYANQAVCGPSRVSFLTGRRPDSTKLYDFGSYWRVAAGNFTTLPEWFRQHGYHTRSLGKVFHPLRAMKAAGHADDYPFSWSEPPYHPSSQHAKNAHVCNNTDSDPSLPDDGKLHSNLVCPVRVDGLPDGTLPDLQTATEAERLLERGGELASHAPFLLAVGFHKPHIPLKFPSKYLSRYPLAAVPMPPASSRFRPLHLPPVAWDSWDDVRSRDDVTALKVQWPYGPMPLNMTALIRRAYASAISYVDEQVGRVLTAIDGSGLGSSTIVCLFGDHGWQLGERGEWAKYSNAEAATRVPLIVRPALPTHRQLPPPRWTDALVELVDVFATLAELACIESPPLCKTERGDRVTHAQGGVEETCVEGTSFAQHVVPRGLAHLSSPTSCLRVGAIAAEAQTSKTAVFSQYPRPASRPVGPDAGNTDLPSLENITLMGYSIRTAQARRYTEWYPLRLAARTRAFPVLVCCARRFPAHLFVAPPSWIKGFASRACTTQMAPLSPLVRSGLAAWRHGSYTILTWTRLS